MSQMKQGGWVSRFYTGVEKASELESTLSYMIAHYYNLADNTFDYQACKDAGSYSQIQMLSRAFADFDPGVLRSDAAAKAFWLNLYNILTLHAVMSENVLRSIRNRQDFFTGFRYQLKPCALSLDEIEHGIIRANSPGYRKFRRPMRRSHPAYLYALERLDPRVHMAFYCACQSSAPLRVFNPGSVETLLNEASKDFLQRQVHMEDQTLHLPMCFHWYKKDFGRKAGILEFVREHHPDQNIKDLIQSKGRRTRIQFKPFDWTLNAS